MRPVSLPALSPRRALLAVMAVLFALSAMVIVNPSAAGAYTCPNT